MTSSAVSSTSYIMCSSTRRCGATPSVLSKAWLGESGGGRRKVSALTYINIGKNCRSALSAVGLQVLRAVSSAYLKIGHGYFGVDFGQLLCIFLQDYQLCGQPYALVGLVTLVYILVAVLVARKAVRAARGRQGGCSGGQEMARALRLPLHLHSRERKG